MTTKAMFSIAIELPGDHLASLKAQTAFIEAAEAFRLTVQKLELPTAVDYKTVKVRAKSAAVENDASEEAGVARAV